MKRYIPFIAAALLIGGGVPFVLSAGKSKPRSRPAQAHASSLSARRSASSADAAQAARSERQAMAWLKRSIRAETTVPHEGREMTITWSSEGRTTSAVALRSHQGDKERTEYLAPQDMAGQVYLSDSRRLRIYYPKKRRLYVGPNRKEDALQLPLLVSNYRLKLEPKTRYAADRPCRLVRLTPRHAGKPSEILWLDRATALKLKQERFHPDGSPASVTQFSDVKIGKPLPASRFRLAVPASVRQPPQTERSGGSGLKPRMPAALHAGYRLQSCYPEPSSRGWHCLYSDGLDTLSLFYLPNEKRPLNRKAETARVGRYLGNVRSQDNHWIVTWNAGTNHWAMIGNASKGLVLKAASSFAATLK